MHKIALSLSILVIFVSILLLLSSSSLVFVRRGRLDCSTLQSGVYCKNNKNLCFKINDSDDKRGFATAPIEKCQQSENCVRYYNECASNKLREMIKNII